MFNWTDAEDFARLREQELSRCLSDAEIAHLDLLTEMDARRPLRSRIAAALVRLGARLDPEVVVLSRPDTELDTTLEASLAAYIR